MGLSARARRSAMSGGLAAGLLAVGAFVSQPAVQTDAVDLVAEVASQRESAAETGAIEDNEDADITGEEGSSHTFQNPAGVQLGATIADQLRDTLAG